MREKDRLCLTGGNGTGKTTLLRVVLGEPLPYTGKIVRNPSLRIGYIPQEIRFTPETDTVLEAFRREVPSAEGQARNILAKYYFTGAGVFKRTSALSGGEKVLLKLAVLVQREVNFLILGEPTNHIDIETREILEDALQELEGTLLCVSHDRYFMEKTATRIVRVRERKIEDFNGSYSALKK